MQETLDEKLRNLNFVRKSDRDFIAGIHVRRGDKTSFQNKTMAVKIPKYLVESKPIVSNANINIFVYRNLLKISSEDVMSNLIQIAREDYSLQRMIRLSSRKLDP